MAFRSIVPWRWGGLRRMESEDRPVESFRREMEAIHRDLDRLFESMWNDALTHRSLPHWPASGELMPQLDITEDDKALHVTVELPGMDEKDVEVTLSDRLLTIRGEKKSDTEDRQKDYYRRERSYGSFRRVLELPTGVEEAGIQASFRNGVLDIMLPKTKEAQEKTRRIDIKAA